MCLLCQLQKTYNDVHTQISAHQMLQVLPNSVVHLVHMVLDLFTVRNSLVIQPLFDFLPLIPLQLDDRSPIFVLLRRAIAVEHLLQVLQDLRVVEHVGDALNGRVTLSSVSLLVPDVDLVFQQGRLPLSLATAEDIVPVEIVVPHLRRILQQSNDDE